VAKDIDEAIRAVKAGFPIPNYIGDTVSVNSYASVARTVQRHLPAGKRILDFGCGPMDKTAVLQQLGYVCAGYDDLGDHWHHTRREIIMKFAREQGIDFRLAGPDFPFPPRTFDMVMMHDVLEHLHDSPRELLTTLVATIRDGGLLFATVPNAGNIRKRISLMFGGTNLPNFDYYYWLPDPWRGHVREYVRGDLVKLASYMGLRIKELKSAHHMLFRVPPALRRSYRVATAVVPGWRDTWVLVAEKPIGWTSTIIDPEKRARIAAKINPRTPTPE